MNFIIENSVVDKFETKLLNLLFEQALNLYPKASPYYITTNKDDLELLGEQLSTAIVMIPALAIREVARIIGYLQLKYNLNKEGIDLAIANFNEKYYNQEITIACLESIQLRHHIFPNE